MAEERVQFKTKPKGKRIGNKCPSASKCINKTQSFHTMDHDAATNRSEAGCLDPENQTLCVCVLSSGHQRLQGSSDGELTVGLRVLSEVTTAVPELHCGNAGTPWGYSKTY